MTLYIIGGASRSGKSGFAKYLTENRGVPYFSIDFLMNGIHRGAPDLGIRHEQDTLTRAEKLWPIVRGMCAALIEDKVTYAVEGEALKPGDVAKLLQGYTEAEVKTIFVGYAEADLNVKLLDCRDFQKLGGYDWTKTMSDSDLLDHLKRGQEHSRYLKKECDKHDILYVDNVSCPEALSARI